ncbi:MAG: flagellar brake protein [Betaproteobacteria bacterium]|nr:flagellar brake protein [Betaproteobacteria bacterium]
MLKRDIEGIEPEVIDIYEKCRIYSASGILSILQSMIQNKSLATCSFGRADSLILTSVIGIDAKRGEMVLDYGADEASNQRALKAGKLNVVTFLDQIKIQFVCDGIQKILFEGRNAFNARIPETLLRMQKRDHYRVVTPTITPVKCAIPLREDGMPAEVILQNISCGGMAVIDTKSEVNFQIGATYRNCLLALPGIGTAKVNLRIQHVSKILQRNGLMCQRARCEYIDTQENMLSMIHRYITRLELEQKRKQ